MGVLSDIHLNTEYDANGSEKDNCTSNDGKETAVLGRFECDPPYILVDYMLTRFSESFGDVDVLLVTGDHVAHDIAPDLDEATKADAKKVIANLRATSDLVKKHFPETMVLTTIGNNDGYHS